MSESSANDRVLRAITYDLRRNTQDPLYDARESYRGVLESAGSPRIRLPWRGRPIGVAIFAMGESMPLAWGYGRRRNGDPGRFTVMAAGVRAPGPAATQERIVPEGVLRGAVYLALSANLPSDMEVSDRGRVYPPTSSLAVSVFREGLPEAFPGLADVKLVQPPYRTY